MAIEPREVDAAGESREVHVIECVDDYGVVEFVTVGRGDQHIYGVRVEIVGSNVGRNIEDHHGIIGTRRYLKGGQHEPVVGRIGAVSSV